MWKERYDRDVTQGGSEPVSRIFCEVSFFPFFSFFIFCIQPGQEVFSCVSELKLYSDGFMKLGCIYS